jgi:fructokinase
MIIVGGENLIDLIQNDDGSSLSYNANLGGSPYNCALAIGLQNSPVGYLSPISSDNFGQLLAKKLTSSNVQILSDFSDKPTSLALVSLSKGIPNYQFYREKTAERMVSFERLKNFTPKTAKAFYLGSLALADGKDADIWADYYCAMHKKGLFTALDPNIRADFIKDKNTYMTRLNSILKHTDLIKLSDEDLSWLFPNEDITKAAKKLMHQTCAKLLIVTIGKKGSFALTNKQIITIKAYPVSNIQDTVGSGDVFMATLLAQLVASKKLSSSAIADMNITQIKELLEWASCAAAINCQKQGCSPPSFATLKATHAKSKI